MKITFVGGPLDERTEERRGLGSLYRDDEGHTIPARVGDAEWFPDRSAGHGTWPLPLRARPVPSADRFYLRQRVADEAGVKELAYVHASAWAEWNTRELREIDGRAYPHLAAFPETTPRGQQLLKAWCRWCEKWHTHGQSYGHRVAHCHRDSPYRETGYVLVCPKVERVGASA